MNKAIQLVIILSYVLQLSCTSTGNDKESNTFYLHQIEEDFRQHREDVQTIYNINKNIVLRIDSLFEGTRIDSTNADLVKGIMNTRAYTMTIMAYKDILNGKYLDDHSLKIKIARHVATFEGMAQSKRAWDAQWDVTARPYLYRHGLASKNSLTPGKINLISDPEFRAILWDRRMFAHDVEIWSPRILGSADSILALIDSIKSH